MQRFAINAQQMVDEMAAMDPYVIIFLLDCCREYWLPRKGRSGNQSVGGLQQMTAPPGTMIAFACAPGGVTPDRALHSKNGIFTKYLLKHITTPGIDIDIILRRVATGVEEETKNNQRPFRVSSISKENVYVVPLGIRPSLNINVLTEIGRFSSTPKIPRSS
ncbi:unnamed protein product [Rotaria sp. Silwood2]|nr:unnamed protein product [Rotaria sp. Silwood2]